jgi:LAGLIDADG endonuclease
MDSMGSDNPSGADNQQETTMLLELDPRWVVGFIDGEGCFSVSLHRNSGAWHGWQIAPVSHAYQHRDGREVLEALRRFFDCGYVRPKGPRSEVLTYAVHARRELLGSVIPFFECHTLLIKRDDFLLFAAIVRSLDNGDHAERAGFERLVRLAYTMNKNGKQRARSIEEVLEGSSETVRQALPTGR